MIERIWHGWTTPANADAYERLLSSEVLPGIVARGIEGFRGARLLRRSLESEELVEFVTILTFESLDAVKAFAGSDYERAYIAPQAAGLLARWDARSQHYERRGDFPV